MPKALILANGFRLQYRTLRCAAPLFESVEVYGTSDSRTLARSFYCRRFHPSRSGPDAFGTPADIGAINEILITRGLDYILPSDADSTRFLAEHRSALAATSYPVPDVETFDALNDKAQFARLCARLDVPHPETQLCDSVDEVRTVLAAAAPGSRFVVKPLGLWGSLGVAMIIAGEAEPVLQSLSYSPILLQTYIPGTEFTTVVLARGGALEKVTHYAREGGAVSFFDQGEATQLAGKIAAALSYDGVMVFDVRVDPEGQLFLIECNPRFWYRMDAAMRAGANFIEYGLWPERSQGKGLFPIRPVRLDGASTILGRFVRPWSLNGSDRAFLRFVLADPLPAAFTLASRLDRRHQAANGRQL